MQNTALQKYGCLTPLTHHFSISNWF